MEIKLTAVQVTTYKTTMKSVQVVKMIFHVTDLDNTSWQTKLAADYTNYDMNILHNYLGP
jgi:hypothetical protein